MRTLALDTGGVAGASACLVAASFDERGARLEGAVSIEPARALGARLMLEVDALLERLGWTREEIEVLTLGAGPGSWTSLRIGFASWTTLSSALALPCAPVPSFDALALALLEARERQDRERQREQRERAGKGAPKKAKRGRSRREAEAEATSIALLLAPSRPGEWAGKIFVVGDDWAHPIQPERLAPLSGLLDAAFSQEMASQCEGPLLLCGAGAGAAFEFLAGRGEDGRARQIEVRADELGLEIARLGVVALIEGQELDFEPLYLAPSNAERARLDFAARLDLASTRSGSAP